MAPPPPRVAQLTLISPRPAALACFSISRCSSMMINGRYPRPYCLAKRTSLTSASAGATIVNISMSARSMLTANKDLDLKLFMNFLLGCSEEYLRPPDGPGADERGAGFLRALCGADRFLPVSA